MKVGYARVSTVDQDPGFQIDALMRDGCERVFHEKMSGAKADRPELIAALDYLRPGDVLVVWKLDRLGRNVRQLLDTVDELHRRGIAFRCLTQDIDTSTASGKLVFHIFAVLSEFERDTYRERTMAGLRRAKEQGRVGGRPRAMAEADILKAKAMMKEQGITMKAIAETLGVSVPTLYRHLPGGREVSFLG